MYNISLERNQKKKERKKENLLCIGWIPALTRCKVTTIDPGHAVFAIVTICVGDLSSAVGPERVVIAVVRPSLAGRD